MRIAERYLIIAAAAIGLLIAACNNDNFSNRGTITAGARFQLVVESRDTPNRLLFDLATGDLWELQPEASTAAKWVRIASGPPDARKLTPQEILGVRSGAASEPQ